MQLSIIIPVYNVEEYIEKCVLSLQQQDIPNEEYEIIIINDGSPDNSREVVLRLMKQFTNIVFIEQENKGVSLARNAGIDKATGDYILFIDPDDYVEINSFNRILNLATESNADIVFLGFTFLNIDNSIKKEIFYSEEKGKVYQGIKAYAVSRGDGRTDPDRTVAILYKTSFINNAALRFISDIPYLEDGEFIARILCLAERCVFEGNSFYIRTTRPGSATNSNLFYSEKSINGFIKAAINLKIFSTKEQLSKEQKTFMNQPIIKFVLLGMESSFHISNWRRSLATKRKLAAFNLGWLSLDCVQPPFKIYGMLYNISPFCCIAYLFWRKLLVSVTIKLKRVTIFFHR